MTNDGSFTVSVSSFEADNRTVPVTLNVTNAPIASTGVSKIEFFTNEGVAGPHRGVIRFVVLQNNGNGVRWRFLALTPKPSREVTGCQSRTWAMACIRPRRTAMG